MRPLGERVQPLVLGIVAYQFASGFLLGLGSDGVAQQSALAVHMLLGPLLALVILPYLRWHVPRMWNVSRRGVRALGLAAMLLVLAACASGLWIELRSLNGQRSTDDWRLYHWGLGLGTGTALLLHLIAVGARAASRARLGASLRGAVRVAAAGMVAATFLALIALGGGWMVPAGNPARDRTAAWVAPTNASCATAGCHGDLHAEWSASAHGWADRDPYYLALERSLTAAKAFDTIALCNECHDPILLRDGRYDRWLTNGSPGAVPHSGEAVACVACHAMSVAHGTRPRGNYELAQPRVGLLEGTAPGNALVRAFPKPHRAANSRALYERSRLCAGCHRADVSQTIPAFGLLRIENPHARWALDNVRPTCQECHMPPVETPTGDHASHRFVGSTAHLSPDPTQRQHVEDLLTGRTPLPGVDGSTVRGPLVTLAVSPVVTTPTGLIVPISLRHANRIGHQFPAGAQDLIELWLEGSLTSSGRTLARWGEQSPGGPLFPGTPVFRRGGFIFTAAGPTPFQSPWQLAGQPFPLLRPGESCTIQLPLPPSAAAPAPSQSTRSSSPAPLQLALRLRYRKLSTPALATLTSASPADLKLPPSFDLTEVNVTLTRAP